MFKWAQQMEVAWSKVGAIRRMLEEFPLLLLHDNARPHTANKTNETLRNFKWEVLEHPPYSPDLAPNRCILNWYTLIYDRAKRRYLMNLVITFGFPKNGKFIDHERASQLLKNEYEPCN
jgi:hypothetical protein